MESYGIAAYVRSLTDLQQKICRCICRFLADSHTGNHDLERVLMYLGIPSFCVLCRVVLAQIGRLCMMSFSKKREGALSAAARQCFQGHFTPFQFCSWITQLATLMDTCWLEALRQGNFLLVWIDDGFYVCSACSQCPTGRWASDQPKVAGRDVITYSLTHSHPHVGVRCCVCAGAGAASYD